MLNDDELEDAAFGPVATGMRKEPQRKPPPNNAATLNDDELQDAVFGSASPDSRKPPPRQVQNVALHENDELQDAAFGSAAVSDERKEPPRNTVMLNDDELQDAAFFDAPEDNAGVVDLSGDPTDDALDLYSGATVRQGLRSTQKSPRYSLSSARNSMMQPTTNQQPSYESNNTGASSLPAGYHAPDPADDDINYFSEDDFPAEQPQRQSYLSTNTARAPPAQQSRTSQRPAHWQGQPKRQRRLRDAASSNTSLARSVVMRPRVGTSSNATHAAAAPSWTSTAASSSAAPAASNDAWSNPYNAARASGSAVDSGPANNNITLPVDGWMNQWSAARATEGAPGNARNDLVGGSGVGAGSYSLVNSTNTGGSFDENYEPVARASRGRGRGKGKKGGWKKGGKSKKGGKRGGGGRGRGRGRGARGGAAASQNDGGAWGDYGGGGGGGGWSAQPSRDDANLGHVGGAEMSF